MNTSFSNLGLLLALIFCRWAIAPPVSAADVPREHLELLRRHGVGTETNEIIAFLRRLQPDEKLQEEIAARIKQLSSTDFSERELATKTLAHLGGAARAQLIEASKSKDPEVAWRSGNILRQLDSGEVRQRRKSLMLAALHVLRDRGAPQAAPVILGILPSLDDRYARDLASEALWASTSTEHANLLRKTLVRDDASLKPIAIVALEIAEGEDAVEDLLAYLDDKDSVVRLAAARALADRRSIESVNALLELVGDEDDDVAWKADALLQLLSGNRADLSQHKTLAAAWRSWGEEELRTAKLNVPLGSRRHDLSAGRNLLNEIFSRDAESVAEGYGRFLYTANNAGGARVVDGKLLIDGDNEEGDQRLYITSQRMIGRDQWPRELEVQVKLGGKEGNNFGWHLGVSVGRVKVLFHLGLSGGAFRAETTDDHDYLFPNENMSFTPATDVIHEMVIKVKRIEGGAEFDVAVHDGRSDAVHKHAFQVSDEQLGDYNRIGLERSGRRGAAAMFDAVSIRLGR